MRYTDSIYFKWYVEVGNENAAFEKRALSCKTLSMSMLFTVQHPKFYSPQLNVGLAQPTAVTPRAASTCKRGFVTRIDGTVTNCWVFEGRSRKP